MLEYLRHRTPAEDQPLPFYLKELTDRRNAVAVTLRSADAATATLVEDGGSLPRNLIAAALKAMRSPLLPDRITEETLAELTVEVAILDEITEVGREEIPAVYVPGLTGLAAERGNRRVHLLPGETVGLPTTRPATLPVIHASETWDAVRACRTLLGRLGTLPDRWILFTTRRFVGRPGEPAVEATPDRLPSSRPAD